MNKNILIMLVSLFVWLSNTAGAQSQETKQLLLDVQKLASLKNILSDLKKGYLIISDGYNSIKNISEGNLNLHEAFLNSLLQVSPFVKKYYHVADIFHGQVKLVAEYKSALHLFKKANFFSGDEISYVTKVYKNLFNKSTKNLDDLATVLTANKLRMTDDERLNCIDNIWKEVSDQLSFVRNFNTQANVLRIQRARAENDISTINKLYDVNH